MIRIYLRWKELLCMCILLALSSAVLYANDKVQQQQSDSSPLKIVTKYLDERYFNNTYQNNKIEKKLVGKQYSGIVEVWDVVGDGTDLIIEAMQKDNGGRGCELRFRIQKSNIKEKAGQLTKYNRILIVATLQDFQKEYYGYNNVSVMYIAMFKDVQKLEVL